MTIGKALNTFFSGFGIPAYPETAVPDDAKMPYITYPLIIAGFELMPVDMGVDVWYRTESEAVPTAKALEIVESIKGGGVLDVDGGFIWLKANGSPLVRAVPDDDNSIKRRALNITAEFFV